jgi:hypothetical protein
MIDPDVKEVFDVFKEHGYVMVYSDTLANRFKRFLDYIEYGYCLDQDRNDSCPERNRFEKCN